MSPFGGRWLREGVPALGIALLVVGIYAQQEPELSLQAKMSLRFIFADSLGEALATYRPVRPPLYVMTLRAFTELGIPVGAVNPLLFGGLLAWLWWFVRRVAPQLNPAIPVALIALAHFNYPMLATLTSEILLTLLVGLWISALLAHMRNPRLWSYLWLCLLTAAACATRYIALFWLLPLACVHLLALRGASSRRRLAKTSGLAAIALTPAGLWMLHAYATTGFVSGMDRFALRGSGQRGGLPAIEQAALTVSNYGKTLFVDFFSTQSWATHKVVNHPYPATLFELFVAGLAIVVFGSAVVFLVKRWAGASEGLRAQAKEMLSKPSELTLLVEVVLVFVVATIAIWIVGNNDRLYSRFLYPSYPFTLLIGFAVYWRVCQAGVGPLLRSPFALLYILMLGLQLFRDFALPGG